MRRLAVPLPNPPRCARREVLVPSGSADLLQKDIEATFDFGFGDILRDMRAEMQGQVRLPSKKKITWERDKCCAAPYYTTTRILGDECDTPFYSTRREDCAVHLHSSPMVFNQPLSISYSPLAGPSWWKDEAGTAGLCESEFPLVVRKALISMRVTYVIRTRRFSSVRRVKCCVHTSRDISRVRFATCCAVCAVSGHK